VSDSAVIDLPLEPDLSDGIELRGAVADLWHMLDNYSGEKAILEILLEGPGGTGKSTGLGFIIVMLIAKHPGIRLLLVRKTRKSLTDSYLKTFEDEVLQQLSPTHEALQGPDRAGRHSYRFPSHGNTEVVCAGMDDPIKTYGTDFDIVVYEEAIQGTEDQWVRFYRALRNWKGGIPYQLLIAVTNPGPPGHWLNHRASEGRMLRFCSRHMDNPKLYDSETQSWTPEGKAYLEGLDSLPPSIRDSLFLGLWTAIEGMIWPMFNEDIHVIDPPMRDGRIDYEALNITSFFGSVDWGHTNPGCLQVWGVDDKSERMYLVAEWYRTGELLEWWADKAEVAFLEFQPFTAFVCDPSQPGSIDAFNARLSLGKRDISHIARGADNQVATRVGGDLAGIDLVADMLNTVRIGWPKMFFFRNALRGGADLSLARKKAPTCTVAEIPHYVYTMPEDGRVVDNRMLETPAKGQADHGCDCTRYAANFRWRKKFARDPVPVEDKNQAFYRLRMSEVFGIKGPPTELNDWRKKLGIEPNSPGPAVDPTKGPPPIRPGNNRI
jgi:hypothetical protein